MDDYFDLVEAQIGMRIAEGAHRRRGILPRGLTMPRVNVGPLALAASTALVVAVAAVVLLGVRGGETGGTAASQADIAPVLVQHFRILRTRVTAADKLPARFGAGSRAGIPSALVSAGWTAYAPAPSVASIGLLPSLARRAVIPRTGYTAWLIPGRRGMCWFSESTSEPVSLPSPAVCVGLPKDPSTALTDGPWADVEPAGNKLVGLVTDRVLKVELVDRSGREYPVPLKDGFYVASYLRPKQRLVAVTRNGIEPLYPQRTPASTSIGQGFAVGNIARASRPVLVLTGPRGVRARLSWEMSCMTRAQAAGQTTTGGPGIRGYGPLQRTYTVPATVPIGFPAGSSALPTCHVAADTTVPAHTHGFVRVAIITH
jgi:hypothetical protein